jgi:hypothetical protein
MWTDQNPPATNVLIQASKDRLHLMIDQLEDGAIRVTAGDLFGSKELCCGDDLVAILKASNALLWAENKAGEKSALAALQELSTRGAEAGASPRI